LLVVFHERAVYLKLGHELLAHSGEESVTRKGELAIARLLFGQNIHGK
jgi:hypothetical protein